MNLLFLNSIGVKVWGGGEKWMLAAAEGLRRRGHAPRFAGRAGGVLLERAAARGFETLPLTVRGDFDPALAIKLARCFDRHRIDIVIANFHRDLRLSALARALSTPVGGRGRRRGVLLVARNGLPILADNWRYRRTYRWMSDGILTNTEAIRRRYLSYGWLPPDFVRVIPNGIDPASDLVHDPPDACRARLAIPLGRPVIGIVGRLVRQKRHDRFLEVGRRVCERHPDVLLLVVGDGPEREALEGRARECGMASQLLFAGFQRDVFPHLHGCDVVTLTSQEEGLPNAVMESMLAARPVVAFDVGGVRELLAEDAGVVVADGDIEGMAAAVGSLIEDRAAAEAMGARARARVLREFTVEKMIDRLEEYFSELRERQGRGNGTGV
ncbi:MAG: glycosyltransferase [Candidatus Eisenbacteria bacterium]|nr:glycosyltransferase [Candidatus Eisenbacteria bacterium]